MRNPLRTALWALACAGISPGALALTFNLIPGSTITLQQQNAFIAAGNQWSALFQDSMVVNIQIDVAPLPSGVLGSAQTAQYITDYWYVRDAMAADATSSADFTAVASLSPTDYIDGLMNRTLENPSATPVWDNNNSNNNAVTLGTGAQFKALGILNPFGTDVDASITFSSSFAYDYDPSDGITGGAFDFIGIATHEIGHALGFISSSDVRDYYNFHNSPYLSEDQIGVEPSVMDLFRFSGPLGSALRDWTLDTRPKYFSIDGGATSIAPFSLGRFFANENQASHWKDNLSLGLMDPTLGAGTLGVLSANDIMMMDVLGYDLTAVPEAGTVWASATLFTLGAWRMRRRKRAAGRGVSGA